MKEWEGTYVLGTYLPQHAMSSQVPRMGFSQNTLWRPLRGSALPAQPSHPTS